MPESMPDYNSVLNEARQLSEADRLKLIGVLWSEVPADSDFPLHEDWAPELERRVAELKAGRALTVPWETIRAEALARIGHAKPS